MSENEKIFDYIFKKYGGIVVPPAPDPDVDDQINQIKHSIATVMEFVIFRYPVASNFYIDFIESLSINAAAARLNDKHYIGMTGGTTLILWDMFSKMFASNKVLLNYGDVSLESDEKNTLNLINHAGRPTWDAYSPTIAIPKDPLRHALSTAYVDMGISFLMLHEVGHVIRGHTGYLASIRKGNSNWEEYSASGNRIDPRISQTLEMDADSFAVNNAFIFAKGIIAGNYVLSHPHDVIYSDLNSFLKHWTFAIHSFFRVSSFEYFDHERSRAASHPPPSIRMMMILQNLVDLFDAHDIPDGNNIIKDLFKVTLQAEAAFSEVTFHDYEPKRFFQQGISAQPYISEIVANWNNVRPLLEPFALGGLPPLK